MDMSRIFLAVFINCFEQFEHGGSNEKSESAIPGHFFHLQRCRLDHLSRDLTPNIQGCRSWGPRGPGWVNPISTRRWGRLCPPHYYLPPGYSELPMALPQIYRAVGAGGQGGHCPQTFNDELTLSQPGSRWGRLCPPHYYLPPGYSDLPTALPQIYQCRNHAGFFIRAAGHV